VCGTIVRMVNETRLDCVIGAASGMREGVVRASQHAAHREAFGALLIDQPLMRNVLADLVVESEAATSTALRLAGATDRALAGDEHEAAFRRIAVAVAKYRVCKRGPAHAAEALECLGGNGYVEESGMPRLYREAPLVSIWEGSGNVAALDVLRVLRREPDCVQAYFAEVERAAGGDARLDAAIAGLRKEVADPHDAVFRARRIVESMAVVLQASLLVAHDSPRGGRRSARPVWTATAATRTAPCRRVPRPRPCSRGCARSRRSGQAVAGGARPSPARPRCRPRGRGPARGTAVVRVVSIGFAHMAATRMWAGRVRVWPRPGRRSPSHARWARRGPRATRWPGPSRWTGTAALTAWSSETLIPSRAMASIGAGRWSANTPSRRPRSMRPARWSRTGASSACIAPSARLRCANPIRRR